MPFWKAGKNDDQVLDELKETQKQNADEFVKKRWSLEASIGLGYARILYDKYPCATCGTKLKDTSKNYLGPTKASLSLIYLIK